MMNKLRLNTHPIIIGQTLLHCRKWYDLSQQDIASLLGVTSQAVSKWELGTSTPDITKLWMISEIFFLDIRKLLTFNDTPYNGVKSQKQRALNYSVNRDRPLIHKDNFNIKRSFFFNCHGSNISYHNLFTCENVFANTKLNNVEIIRSNIDCTNFTNCKLDQVVCIKSTFNTMRFIMNVQSYKLQECKVINCIFINELMKNCTFLICNIDRSSYDECTMTDCVFRKCHINNSILFNTTFQKCKFNDLSFTNNRIRNVSFIDCTFDKKSYELLKKANVTIETPTITEPNLIIK